MRVCTILAAGAFAVTAILGSAGSALADDHDEHRSEGAFRVSGQFAGAGDGHAFCGAGCAESHWEGDGQEHHSSF